MDTIWKKLLSYAMVFFGCALTAAAFGWIILPQELAAGGVTGLAALLHQFLPLPLSLIVLVINAVLFVSGWVYIGKEFVFKSLIASLVFPLLLEVFQAFPLLSDLAEDPLLSSLIAGCLLGLGTGMVLLGDGSGGGFDIRGVMLHKRFRLPVSAVMYVCDFTVIAAHAASHPLMKTIYGVIVIIVVSLITNRLLAHGQSSVKMLIFSQQHEAIRQELLLTEDVGMTFLNGESGFKREPVRVILTVIPYSKVSTVKKTISRIDPYAFLLIESVRYVGGRGYTLER